MEEVRDEVFPRGGSHRVLSSREAGVSNSYASSSRQGENDDETTRLLRKKRRKEEKKKDNGAARNDSLPSFLRSKRIGRGEEDIVEEFLEAPGAHTTIRDVRKKRKIATPDGKDSVLNGSSRGEYVELLKAKDLRIGTKLLGCIAEVFVNTNAKRNGRTDEGLMVCLPHGLKGFVPINEVSDDYVASIADESDSDDDMDNILEEEEEDADDDNDVMEAVLASKSGSFQGDGADKKNYGQNSIDGKKRHFLNAFKVDQIVGCIVINNTNQSDTLSNHKSKFILSMKLSRLQGAMKLEGIKVGTTLRYVEGPICIQQFLNLRIAVQHLKGLLVCIDMSNRGCIRSIEDYGFLVNLGIKNINGFLNFKDCSFICADIRKEDCIGSIVEVMVKTIDKRTKTIELSAMRKDVVAKLITDTAGISFPVLQPGWLVTCRVSEVVRDGLKVSFLKFFNATIDQFHLSLPIPPNGIDLSLLYKVGEKLKARILYVSGDMSGNNSKRIGLSLQKHLLLSDVSSAKVSRGEIFQKCFKRLEFGEIVQKAVVARCDPRVGILVEIPEIEPSRSSRGDDSKSGNDETQSAAAYIHVSHLSDNRVEKIEKMYKAGQNVVIRIIGHRPIDGLNVATMRQSLLSAPFLSSQDAKVGMIVSQCHVVAVKEWGVVVVIGSGAEADGNIRPKGIKAMIPGTHLSDSGSRKSLKRIKIGSKLECRVLSIFVKDDENPTKINRSRIVLTHKRSLVHNDELPLLLHISEAVVGNVHHGFVSSIKGYGILIRFFGKVRGLVHRSEIAIIDEEDDEETVCAKLKGLYSNGQLIRVVIRSIGSSNAKMSLGLLDGNSSTSNSNISKNQLPPVGKIFERAKVVSLISEDHHTKESRRRVVVELHCADYVDRNQTMYGTIDFEHLSDYADLTNAEWESLTVGKSFLGPLMVLQHHYGSIQTEKDSGSAKVGWFCMFTCKDAMIEGVRRYQNTDVSEKKNRSLRHGFVPGNIDQIHVGDILVGFIASISSSGLHIRYLDRVTGLAHSSRILLVDGKKQQAHQIYKEGQTVFAEVLKVDLQTENGKPSKFSLSLVGIKAEYEDEKSDKIDLKAAYMLRRLKKVFDSILHGKVSKVRIGECLSCQVESIERNGFVVTIQNQDDNIDRFGFIVASKRYGDTVVVGEILSAIVLDIGDDGVYYMSMHEGLMSTSKENVSRKKERKGEQQKVLKSSEDSFQRKATIHLVKETYIVVSVDESENLEIYYAPTQWYNTCFMDGRGEYNIGDSVYIHVLSAEDNEGYRIASLAENPKDDNEKAEKQNTFSANDETEDFQKSNSNIVKKAIITEIEPHRLIVSIGSNSKIYGSIHITEVRDPPFAVGTEPLKEFWEGQVLDEKVAFVRYKSGGKRSFYGGKLVVDLSMRPSLLDRHSKTVIPIDDLEQIRAGETICGYAVRVDSVSNSTIAASQKFLHHSIFIAISRYIKGRLHIFDAVKDFNQALAFFNFVNTDLDDKSEMDFLCEGKAIEARVLYVDSRRKILDLSGETFPNKISCKTSALQENSVDKFEQPALRVGERVLGIVTKILDTSLIVQISRRQYDSQTGKNSFVTGRVGLSEISDSFVCNPTQHFDVGIIVWCSILRVEMKNGDSEEEGHQYECIDLSTRESRGGSLHPRTIERFGKAVKSRKDKKGKRIKGSDGQDVKCKSIILLDGKRVYTCSRDKELAVGDSCTGYVKAPPTSRGCFVSLAHDIDAFIQIRDLSDNYIEKPELEFPPGKLVSGKVISLPDSEEKVDVGQSKQNLMCLSLKSKVSGGESKRTLSTFEMGEIVYGTAKRIVSYGIFLSIDDSDIVALCHISDLHDDFVKDIMRAGVSIGDRVKVKVLGVKLQENQMNVGIKESLFLDDESRDDAHDNDMESEEDEEQEEDEDGDVEDDGDTEYYKKDDSEEEEEEEEEEQNVDDGHLSGKKKSLALIMKDLEPLDYDTDMNEENEVHKESNFDVSNIIDSDVSRENGKGNSDEDEAVEDEKIASRQKRRKQRKLEKQLRESRIAEFEQRSAIGKSSYKDCTNKEDFERLIYIDPDSGRNWAEYANYLTSVLGEYESAKSLIERGITTINYRCQDEKLIVWKKLLQIEFEKEVEIANSIQQCLIAFEKGRNFNDERSWFFSLLNLFKQKQAELMNSEFDSDADDTEKQFEGQSLLFNESERIIKMMQRKFRESTSVWLVQIELLLKQQSFIDRRNHKTNSRSSTIKVPDQHTFLKAARSVLDRSLQALPQRKHLKVIISTAICHYEIGKYELAANIFENLLVNNPHKIDVWSVYLDQEIKTFRRLHGDLKWTQSIIPLVGKGDPNDISALNRIRLLFDRATALDLKPKKMKIMFKKYLDFETNFASNDEKAGNRVDYVKRRAMDFVEKKIGNVDE